MSEFLERLAGQGRLLFDGAMGTALYGRGLEQGACPELWNVERPDEVRAVSASYAAVGADVVETNTFGGTRLKLAHYGLGGEAARLNREGARLAREGAGEGILVAGSMGPTGAMLEPYGDVKAEEVYEAFREQAEALAAGGVDLIAVETMLAMEEALLALRAAKEGTGLPVAVTFTFDRTAKGDYRTMMGVSPERVAKELPAAGADVIGSNCGNGPEGMVAVCEQLRAVGETPILVQPNAGLPVSEGGQTVYKQTAAQMAAVAPRLLAAGARLLGGCCGTRPEHVGALRAVLDAAGR